MDAAVALAFERLAGITPPAGMTLCISFEPYSQARVMANAATAYLNLGQPARAITYGEEITVLVDASDSAWSQALVRLDLATAYLQQRSPDVEHAMALGIAALAAAADRPIRSIWQRARELNAMTDRWHAVRMVQEFIDALRQWEAQPGVRVLASHPWP